MGYRNKIYYTFFRHIFRVHKKTNDWHLLNNFSSFNIFFEKFHKGIGRRLVKEETFCKISKNMWNEDGEIQVLLEATSNLSKPVMFLRKCRKSIFVSLQIIAETMSLRIKDSSSKTIITYWWLKTLIMTLHTTSLNTKFDSHLKTFKSNKIIIKFVFFNKSNISSWSVHFYALYFIMNFLKFKFLPLKSKCLHD